MLLVSLEWWVFSEVVPGDSISNIHGLVSSLTCDVSRGVVQLLMSRTGMSLLGTLLLSWLLLLALS